MDYYIASCVFTTRFPELSFRIQSYLQSRAGISIVRCCVPNYKLTEFTERLPEEYREAWSALPDSGDFQPEDRVFSLCHNCSAIIDEWKPGTIVRSLWELILDDPEFPYPDYAGARMIVQDCWRAYDRRSEQDAVRRLLEKMNVTIIEQNENYEKTRFCGNSLYRPAPPRNLKLAPKRFVDGADGLFLPHTEAEQADLMRQHCHRFHGEKAVAYCHYCLEGLKLGGGDAVHLAELLFEKRVIFT